MTILRLVGGTDVQPTAARASHAVFTGLDKNPVNYRTAKTRTVADETLSTTAKNGEAQGDLANGRGSDAVLASATGF
jgi:hypothetical protein